MKYKVEINKSPIDRIEVSQDLSCLQIYLDIPYSHSEKFHAIRKNIAQITQPDNSKVVLGCVAFSGNIIEIDECKNIEKALAELKDKFYFVKSSSVYEKLQNEGKVHTIQCPIDKLHQAGFLNDEQLADITRHIEKHVLRKDQPQLIEPQSPTNISAYDKLPIHQTKQRSSSSFFQSKPKDFSGQSEWQTALVQLTQICRELQNSANQCNLDVQAFPPFDEKLVREAFDRAKSKCSDENDVLEQDTSPGF